MAWLIDTSVLIDLERQGLSLDALADAHPDEEVALASMTASELLVGVHRADNAVRRRRRESFVERLLRIVPVLPFDLEGARIHAAIGSHLMARGERIGAHDLVIAATALANGCGVLTANVRDFERVPGLEVARSGRPGGG